MLIIFLARKQRCLNINFFYVRTCGFGGREQLKPILHYGRERVHTDFRSTRHQPSDHLASPPVQRGQRNAHYLLFFCFFFFV